MTQEEANILKFLQEQGATEGKVREAFGAISQVTNLTKQISDLKISQRSLEERIVQLEADSKANNDLILDWQSKVTTANSKISKLEAEVKLQADEKNVWKNRYEEALKSQINKYTGWQLIKLGVQKLTVKK